MWKHVFGICGFEGLDQPVCPHSLIRAFAIREHIKCINRAQMPERDFAHARDESERAFCACSKTPFCLAWPIWSYTQIRLMSRVTAFPTRLHVCPAKTMISMRIRAVWSVFAVRLKTLWLPAGCPAKILIRLHGCAGWSESLLGAHAIL